MSAPEKHLPGKPPTATRSDAEARHDPGTATRCPFCHDSCTASEDVRVCSRCLTRHHTACWGEGHGCASCGASEPLARLSEGGVTPAKGFFAEHKQVLLRWELLRIPYNLILFGLCGVMLGGQVLKPGMFLEGVFAALVANVCYTLGPGLEVYLRTLGVRQRWVGPALFVAGLLFSMLVTAMACLLS